MFITPSFKKSLIVEQFQGDYLKFHFAAESDVLIPVPPRILNVVFVDRAEKQLRMSSIRAGKLGMTR